MNVIALTPAEVSNIATAKTEVNNAKIAMDKATADYNTAFNALLTAHNLDKGTTTPTLSTDGAYLIIPNVT